MKKTHWKKSDGKVFSAIEGELKRQREGLEMIPSENYPSLAVMRACGSVVMNKYSEGYPGKRYYGGAEFVDRIENLAIERAKKLFGTSHANVQGYSGSPANMAAYFALAEPGDKILGLHLFSGGHLTHGWKVNFSAKFYSANSYSVGEDGLVNYDSLEKVAKEVRPKIIFSGSTAYPRIWDYKRVGEIARSVGAYYVSDISHEAGLVAAKLIESPAGHADVITTTSHKTLRGPRGAIILCNGNPSEPLKPPKEKTRENIPTLIDRAVFPGLQGGPHNNTTAGIAVALGEALRPDFKRYARQIVRNSKALAGTLIDGGLDLVTGGTDNHLMLIDLRKKEFSGKDFENALEVAGITANKNTVPGDARPPYVTSGVRLGTPALTTRGMREKEMEEIGEIISEIGKNPSRARAQRERVRKLAGKFPLYPEL